MGERLRSTEGAKLSGACWASRTVYGHNSGESLMGAEGARTLYVPYLSGKRTEQSLNTKVY